MKNYVVTAKIEFEANSAAEAENIVIGAEFVDFEGKSIEEVYIEIDEVLEVG